jgi:enoyl-CoA hydratase
VGAVLLRGEGRAFCAGGDVKGMAATAAEDSERNPAQSIRQILGGARDLVLHLIETPQPIVSAIHGYAMGLGATIGLLADVPIVADDAVLADTHPVIGLVAGDGGALAWPLNLPINTAKYYLMTGDRITGVEAARLGLAVRSVPADQLAEESRALAHRLAHGPAIATQWSKHAVQRVVLSRFNEVMDVSLALEGASMYSEDHREATQAFVERREPRYTGR